MHNITSDKENIMNLKDEYIEKVEEQIEEWEIKIAKLKAKADQYEAEARADYHDKINALEKKHHETKLKLKEIEEASEESWHDIKIGYEKIRREMSEYIEDAITESV